MSADRLGYTTHPAVDFFNNSESSSKVLPNTPLLSRTATVASATLLSRLLGVVRDMCIAWLLGGPAADVLVPALRLPNLVRRLLGEGTLSMTLTAAFSRVISPSARTIELSDLTRKARQQDYLLNPLAPLCRLTASLGLRLICSLIALVVLGEFFASPLLLLLAPGFAEQAELAPRCVFLLRVCLPYIIFAGGAAVAMALLHSLGHFFLPSASSVFFNVTMIAFAGLAALQASDPALFLALGMLCGGIVQFLLLAFSLRLLGIRFFPAPAGDAPRASPALFPHVAPHVSCITPSKASVQPSDARSGDNDTTGDAHRILRRLPAGVLGAAAPQFALLAAGALASGLSEGSSAALYYAERLLDFPLGLTGIALGIASLPSLAALAAARDAESLRREIDRALRLACCVSLPAAAGLAAVAEPLIRLLFFHGAFDIQALSNTVLALYAYVPALPAYAASRPLLALCNAQGKTRLTAFSACIAVPFAFISGLLMLPLGIIGPPLGFSLGMWAQCFLLRFALRRNNIISPFSPSSLLRYAAGSALVFASARFFLHLLPVSPVSLMLTVIAAAVLYVLFLFLTGEPGLTRLMQHIQKTP